MTRLSKWIPFGAGEISQSSMVLGALALGAILISVACGSSSSSASGATEMRVVQLAPDEQQPLEMLIDNKSVFSSIAYGVPTAFTTLTAVNHDLKLNLSGTNLFDSPTEPFVKGTSYTYLVTSSLSAGVNLQGNKLIDDHTVADKGMFKIRVVNGSPNAGAVDVYVVTPSTPFNVTPPVKPTVAGLASNAASTYQSLASGSYDIFITPAGDQSCLILSVPCLINLDGRNNTAVPAFQAGQNRTLIMLNQVPLIPGGSLYTTLPMLADLN